MLFSLSSIVLCEKDQRVNRLKIIIITKKSRRKFHFYWLVSNSMSFRLRTESKSKQHGRRRCLNYRWLGQWASLQLIYSCGPAKTTCPLTMFSDNKISLPGSNEAINTLAVCFLEDEQHVKRVKVYYDCTIAWSRVRMELSNSLTSCSNHLTKC